MYDVNPNETGDSLSLNVLHDSNMIDFGLALASAEYYGLTEKQAGNEIKEIKNTVEGGWKKLAKQYGLSRSDIEHMAPAFEMKYKG